MKVLIEKGELDRLYDKAYKLNCLESAGVDNWEGYDFALEAYWEQKNKEEKIKNTVDELLEVLCMGVNQPAGTGCGYGFTEDSQSEVYDIIKKLLEDK